MAPGQEYCRTFRMRSCIHVRINKREDFDSDDIQFGSQKHAKKGFRSKASAVSLAGVPVDVGT